MKITVEQMDFVVKQHDVVVIAEFTSNVWSYVGIW
jgi:hypothetical protein